MSTLLVLAGPASHDSISRPLAIQLAGPNAVWRDLAEDPIPTVTEGVYPHVKSPLLAEVVEADRIVIASPVHNFMITAALKAWIDQIVVSGGSFAYTQNGPAPLLPSGKEVIVVVSSAGTEVGSPGDFFSQYLKFVFNFIGITDVAFINARTAKDEGYVTT